MSSKGENYKEVAVRFERRLPGPAERVWALISDPATIPAWYGEDGVIEGREGGAVSMSGGHIKGVVTQWRPGRKIAYTWNVFSPGEAESPYLESYLALELSPEGGEVKLTLTHLPILERFVAQNSMGWHTFLDMVEASARGEPVQPRPHYMQKNAALYGVDLGALTR